MQRICRSQAVGAQRCHRLAVESQPRVFLPHPARLSEQGYFAIHGRDIHIDSVSRLQLGYSLQASMPHLTRSSLHRCLQRHGISRLPEVEGDKPDKKKFKPYPIGYFHVDIAEVQTDEGRLYLFVAIDRTSKFAYAELHPRATRMVARDFLSNLINAVPYAIHTLLTDNGIQFAKRKGTEAYREIPFDRVCRAQGIEHRLTKVCHPWTNGQVERMNRTIKEATVKRY